MNVLVQREETTKNESFFARNIFGYIVKGKIRVKASEKRIELCLIRFYFHAYYMCISFLFEETKKRKTRAIQLWHSKFIWCIHPPRKLAFLSLCVWNNNKSNHFLFAFGFVWALDFHRGIKHIFHRCYLLALLSLFRIDCSLCSAAFFPLQQDQRTIKTMTHSHNLFSRFASLFSVVFFPGRLSVTRKLKYLFGCLTFQRDRKFPKN